MKKITSKNFIWVVLVASIIVMILLASNAGAISQPKNTKSGSTLKQRIQQRKAERGINLKKIDRERIEGICQISQTKIRDLRDSYVPIADKRSKTYNQIDSKLWVIIGGLKYIEFDTFGLERQRIQLLSQIDNYERLYDQFNEALDDAVNMNCKADPNGFQALIETSRIYNVQIRDQLNEITKYTNDTVRKTLSSITETLRVRASDSE